MAKQKAVVDDGAAFREKIAVLVAGLKPAEPPAPVVEIGAKDLVPPKFLRRKKTKETADRVARVLQQETSQRAWAPIRKKGEWTEKPTMPLQNDHPDLPVKVQVKDPKRAGSTLLATYANMAEFEAKHNKATYPVKGQPMQFQGHTVILVTAKPWADKEKNAVKREGPKASAVNVDGVLHDSVLFAFQALKLPVNKHQKFRAELKKARALPFVHEGKTYNFSYDLDVKPKVEPVIEPKKPAAKKKVAAKTKKKGKRK